MMKYPVIKDTDYAHLTHVCDVKIGPRKKCKEQFESNNSDKAHTRFFLHQRKAHNIRANFACHVNCSGIPSDAPKNKTRTTACSTT